ncbi:phosphatase PAP2 family protein [Actinomadura sp. 7K507]|uniref:phosphatase PAP2 family protein n=1 Tax=Actinomadura sp. 7K507 TaxID=2530365 RepID=UPI0010441636|nr:phosphatase PAP2 family protein [Actinomadura sp. 7K507]TDC88935.1 phosphatase PAP2 family protein [Actinomadura sp. 7K507]
MAARATVILLFSAFVNTFLKLLFHDPRPYWTDPTVEGEQPHSSFGMPSGHAQNAPVAWGFWAAHSRRRPLWAATAVIIALIGLSRVFLGVHSIGQVLAGWGIGLALLAAGLFLEPVIVSWWTRHHLAVQMALALAVPLLLLGAAWVAFQPIQDWRWPNAWARAIRAAGGDTEPVDLVESARLAGGFSGVLAGFSLLAARGWFDAAGELWRRLARLPVALAGAAVVYLPALLFDGTDLVQAYIVQAVLGLWVTAGAPEAFVRLRLAARPTPALTRPGDEPSELRQ